MTPQSPRPSLVRDLPDPPELTDADLERIYAQERAWREWLREKREQMECVK